MPHHAQQLIQSLLNSADIKVNGSNPWDIQVHDERLYRLVLAQGSLGLGEAYMDGWWDCEQIDEMLTRVFRADLEKQVARNWRLLLRLAPAYIFNFQSRARAFQIGQAHYDIGNDLYSAMLDQRLTYTCGYWKDAKTLDAAQESKLDLTCRKIGLKRGDRVLDIGCGWGSFLKFAAERYGAQGIGITVSRAQVELGSKMCKGLPIEIRLQDYREVKDGPYDHIISLGMFEHVGYKNYRAYMEAARRLLKPDGLFLLHTIGGNRSVKRTDPWIEKYIFPNSMLPSIAQIGRAIERQFVMEDWHNFSADYDKTLMFWYQNFENAWPTLRANYSARFRRMWRFYLLTSAAGFRARKNQLWQIILAPFGAPGGYQSLR